MSTIASFTEDYRFLSNFYADTPRGTTLEHHYQAAKTDDPEWAARIMLARTPNDAKKLGRRCPMRDSWDEERLTVMLVLLRMKFSDTRLTKKLLKTKNAKLVEGNTWGDTYWGVYKNEGQNHLGRLLMQVRTELREARQLTRTP